MKEGTGGDPFGDDPFGDDDSSDDPLGESNATDSGEAEPNGDGGAAADASDSAEPADVDTEDSSRDSTGDAGGDDGLPWAVERNSVKSDREMVQFYLREFAQDRESEFQREVEAETGYDTYLTDVREAAYLVAMNHPEEVAELLDDWGCEYV
jgi:hypothetical protein